MIMMNAVSDPLVYIIGVDINDDKIIMIIMMMIAVSDPRVYIICVDGQPRLQSCGAHDEFDQDTLTCVRKHPFVFL